MADSSTFEIPIVVTGGSAAEQAAGQLDRLQSALTGASSAAVQANQALSAGEQAYAQAERAADKAAKAVEKIGLAADAQRGKMKAALDAGDETKFWKAAAAIDALNQKQAEASKKADAAKSALATQATALDKLKAAAAGAVAEEDKLKKTIDEAKKAEDAAAKAAQAAEGTGSARAISSGLGKLGGPLGTVGQKVFALKGAWDKLNKALGSAGPYVAIAVALVAVAAGVAAVGVAAVLGVAKITAWAVGLADANRSQNLLYAGMLQSATGGDRLNEAIYDMQKRIPLTRDELNSMAADLAKTGLRGQALTDALDTAATKAAKLKFGPEFGKQLLSLDNQTTRFKDNIAHTFGGLKIDKLLEAFSHLVELFDTSNASGRAMKVVFESIFQPLIDGVTQWLPKVRTAFIQTEILILKALIAVKPFGSQILLVVEALGILTAVVLGALVLAIGVITAGVAAMAVGFAALIVIVTAVVGGVLYLGYTLASVGQEIYSAVVGAITAMTDYLGSVSLGDIATAMIDGLVNGITGAGSRVLQAMTGVVGGAVDAAKKALGIASPSKVFAEIGGYTAEGFAGGVDDGASQAQGALERMVAPPEAPAAAATPAPAAKADTTGGGGGNVFNFYGVEGAEDAIDRFTRLLEGDAAQLSGAVSG